MAGAQQQPNRKTWLQISAVASVSDVSDVTLASMSVAVRTTWLRRQQCQEWLLEHEVSPFQSLSICLKQIEVSLRYDAWEVRVTDKQMGDQRVTSELCCWY